MTKRKKDEKYDPNSLESIVNKLTANCKINGNHDHLAYFTGQQSSYVRICQIVSD